MSTKQTQPEPKPAEPVDARRTLGSEIYGMHRLHEDLDALYDALEGEVTGLTEAIEERLGAKRHEVVEALVMLVRESEGMAECAKRERDRYAEIVKRAEHRRKWGRGQILALLGRAGLKKLELEAGGFVRVNPGRPSVEIDPDLPLDMLDERFVKRPEPTLNKTAISKAVKDGEAVPGAKLVTGPSVLVIK